LSVFSGSIANAARHSLEDYDREKLDRRVEPLLFLIREGRNWFMPRQFSDLCLYLLNEQQVAYALDTGRFVIGGSEVIRTEHVDESRLVTLSALAKMSGVQQRTLWNRISKAGIPFIRRGNKKLYNIDELRLFLERSCA
jgi:hypothetical protein